MCQQMGLGTTRSEFKSFSHLGLYLAGRLFGGKNGKGTARWRYSRRPHFSASQPYSTARLLDHPTTRSPVCAILDERYCSPLLSPRGLAYRKGDARSKVMISLRRSMHSTRCSLCNVKRLRTFTRSRHLDEMLRDVAILAEKAPPNSLSTLSTCSLHSSPAELHSDQRSTMSYASHR